MTLTPKQEAFALAYVETSNASEAYRRAYNVKAATLHTSIWVAASKLMADAKVSQRIAEIQSMVSEMALYTIKDAFDEYEAARKQATELDNPSAAVSAITGKVKLFGLEAPAKAKLEHSGTIKAEIGSDAAFAAIASLLGGVVPATQSGTDSPDKMDTDSQT